MRVEYPLNNLKRKIDFLTKIEAVKNYRMSYIGYLIMHGDFTNKSLKRLSDVTPEIGLYEVKAVGLEEVPRDKEFIEWIKIGTDVCLFYMKKYRELFQTFQSKCIGEGLLTEENIVKNYIIANKDEFPDAYLELIL